MTDTDKLSTFYERNWDLSVSQKQARDATNAFGEFREVDGALESSNMYQYPAEIEAVIDIGRYTEPHTLIPGGGGLWAYTPLPARWERMSQILGNTHRQVVWPEAMDEALGAGMGWGEAVRKHPNVLDRLWDPRKADLDADIVSAQNVTWGPRESSVRAAVATPARGLHSRESENDRGVPISLTRHVRRTGVRAAVTMPRGSGHAPQSNIAIGINMGGVRNIRGRAIESDYMRAYRLQLDNAIRGGQRKSSATRVAVATPLPPTHGESGNDRGAPVALGRAIRPFGSRHKSAHDAMRAAVATPLPPTHGESSNDRGVHIALGRSLRPREHARVAAATPLPPTHGESGNDRGAPVALGRATRGHALSHNALYQHDAAISGHDNIETAYAHMHSSRQCGIGDDSEAGCPHKAHIPAAMRLTRLRATDEDALDTPHDYDDKLYTQYREFQRKKDVGYDSYTHSYVT